MNIDEQQLDATLAFIRKHRSNEANMPQILARLDDVLQVIDPNSELYAELSTIKGKQLPAYQDAKAASGNPWPEFENVVSHFERSLTAALKKINGSLTASLALSCFFSRSVTIAFSNKSLSSLPFVYSLTRPDSCIPFQL